MPIGGSVRERRDLTATLLAQGHDPGQSAGPIGDLEGEAADEHEGS
jgi:hypothetical protein